MCTCDRASFIGGLLAAAVAPAAARADSEAPQYLELGVPAMRQIASSVWVAQLSPRVWLHTTTKVLDGSFGYYPANGIVVEGDGRALLIDTGWFPHQTQSLLRFWKSERRVPIGEAFVTHFHKDRTGGVDLLRERGIEAKSLAATVRLAREHGFPIPSALPGLELHAQQLPHAQAYYPGAGHTVDNTVVYVPDDRVLFGGCLVKSVTAHDLGNLADADVPLYASTIERVCAQYPHARAVVPGHGTIHGDSLAHTLAMAKAAISRSVEDRR